MNKVIPSLLISSAVILAAPVLSSARSRARIENPTLRLADKIAPKYGLRPEFVRALVCRESACGLMLKRRETSKSWDRAVRKKVGAQPGTMLYEQMMSSLGAMQIGGVWAWLEHGIAPSDLYDDSTNIELGCAMLAKHMKGCAGDEFCAAARHNGGPHGERKEAARRYAAEVLRLARAMS